MRIKLNKKHEFIQDSMSSCGAMCIASLLSYYGGYVPNITIVEDTLTDKNGTNALNIVNTLKKYGFNAYGIKLELESISRYHLPCIAHIVKNGYEHFVVIYAVDDKKIYSMDPEVGYKEYSFELFKQYFDNYILIAKPLSKIVKYEKRNTLSNLIKESVFNKKRKLFSIVLFSLITIFLETLIGVSIKYIYLNSGIVPIYIMIIILNMIINYYKNKYIILFSSNIGKELVEKFINNLFKVNIKYLENSRRGEILKKINDLEEIRTLFIDFIVSIPISLITFITLSIVMIIINTKLFIIILLIYIIYVVIGIIAYKKIYYMEKISIDKKYQYVSNLNQNIQGMHSIKNINEEEYFINQSVDNYRDVESANIQISKYINKIYNLMSLIKNLINILIISICIYYSNINILNIIIFVNLSDTITTLFNKMLDIYANYLKCKAFFRPTSEFFDIEKENIQSEYFSFQNALIIDNIKYSYDKYHYILKDVNLKILKGDKILLYGESGLGKSTLVKIINKTIQDYEGNILIDDINYNNITQGTIRSHIIYVGSNEMLFNMSIKDNIVFSNKSENFDKILDITHINKIFKKNNISLNHQILEEGTNISSGEKAKILLARALNKNPSILIIDETLSTIPNYEEDEIIRELLKIKDLTLIYITHRNKKELFTKTINIRKEGLQYEHI